MLEVLLQRIESKNSSLSPEHITPKSLTYRGSRRVSPSLVKDSKSPMKTLMSTLLTLACCLHLWCVGDTLTFKSLNLFPESFDFDPSRDRVLLGSASKGTISELFPGNGTVREVVRDEEVAGRAATGGLVVDGGRNRVVVTVQDIVGWRFGGVAAYDLETGRRLFFTRLDHVGVAEGEVSCANDVAVDTTTGDAFVTNCRGNFLWKVTERGTPSVFVTDSSFSQPSLFDEAPWCTFNGIVHDQKHHLLAIQTNSGALFRVDVRDRSVRLVAMPERLPGADGMALRDDGALVVVSARKVWLVRSRSGWVDAEVVDSVVLDAKNYATAASVRGGAATFVLHAHLADMYANRTREEFAIQEIKFPSEVVSGNSHFAVSIIVFVVTVVVVLLAKGSFINYFR